MNNLPASTSFNPALTGFFNGLEFEDYLKLSGVSNSFMNQMAKSPEDALWYKRHEKKLETKSMEFGTHMHCAILEPNELDKRYAYMPDCDGRTKEGKSLKAEYEFKNAGKIVLKEELWESAQYVREKLLNHSRIPALLNNFTPEVSMQWEYDGLLYKGRCDALHNEEPYIVDIKTAKSAHENYFEHAIFNLGYHRQAAMYTHGCEVLGRKIKKYFIIAIENTAPWKEALFEVPESAIEIGRAELKVLSDKYKECRKTNQWPGYSHEVKIVGVPHWKLQQLPDALLNNIGDINE